MLGKVCVYAICKNEEQFVQRWMRSVREADLVIISDTGSTDKTAEKLSALGAIVYHDVTSPWRFDSARNRAMEHIPHDVDICVSADLDEFFRPGWRAALEARWDDKYTRAKYTYVWSHDENGSPDVVFQREKIHRRHGFQWVHPVHEVLEYQGQEQVVEIPEIVLEHYPDPNKSRSQYLPLLELSVRENPGDDRGAFWLGREYFYHERYDRCIESLQSYLKLPGAVWDEERSAAMRYISKSHLQKGDGPGAVVWALKAAAECPKVREPYLQGARSAYGAANWELLLYFVVEGLKIQNPSGSYLAESDCWGPALYDYGAIAAHRLGIHNLALNYASEALKLSPEDERLLRNLEVISGGLKEQP